MSTRVRRRRSQVLCPWRCKAAAFAAWVRILMHKLSPLDSDWVFPSWLMAMATMTLGNLLALSQSSVKRMLAYSSIAHAGYLLIALVVGEEWGGPPLLFVGNLCVYDHRGLCRARQSEGPDGPRKTITISPDWDSNAPFSLQPCRSSCCRLPVFPLAGFTGQFYIFRSAVLAGHTHLAIIAVLNGLLSVVYYLRVIVAMYMEEGGREGEISFRRSPYLYIAVALAVVGTLYLGIIARAGPRVEPGFFFRLD